MKLRSRGSYFLYYDAETSQRVVETQLHCVARPNKVSSPCMFKPPDEAYKPSKILA